VHNAPSILQKRIDSALAVRRRIPLAAQADSAQPLIPSPTWEVVFENIGLDGLYRVLLIAVKDSTVRVLTNLTQRQGTSPFIGAPGVALVAYHGESQRLADTIGARLSAMQFVDGIGGVETAADGAVHFLTIRSAAQARSVSTALYFYNYPATSGHWHAPTGVDAARWEAVRDTYELWRSIVTDPVVTST